MHLNQELALGPLLTPIVTEVLRLLRVAKQILAAMALEHLTRCFGCLGRGAMLNPSNSRLLNRPLNRLAAPPFGQGRHTRHPMLLFKTLCCFDQIAGVLIYPPQFASVQNFLQESY